jgi:hypothetical protein
MAPLINVQKEHSIFEPPEHIRPEILFKLGIKYEFMRWHLNCSRKSGLYEYRSLKLQKLFLKRQKQERGDQD